MFEVFREATLRPLLNNLEANLIVIEAPAGSGKTTLLRQFREQLSRRGLYQIIVQPGSQTGKLDLLRDLLNAIGAGRPNTDVRPSHRDDAIEMLAERFFQELLLLPSHCYIIIDDFHRYKSPATIKFLTRLVHFEPRLPATIVVASRVATDIPVSALRLRGKLVELGQEDLKFSELEANALRSLVDPNLDEAIWTAFSKKVDGWAVALQLALILLREKKLDISDLLNFSGTQREMASYLSLQIVESISEPDRVLLYAAAAFDSLRPDVIAAALSPKRAERLLDLIATLALPTEISGGRPEDIRLHGVVQEFLEAHARAQQVDLHSLQRQAAEFLEGCGEWRKAIRYGLTTGDIAFAAGIAERGGGWRLVYRGEEGTPSQFNDLSKLPRKLFRSYPRTVLGLSVSAAKRGEIDLARDLLAKVAAVADATDVAIAAELRLISALMDLYSDRQSTPEAIEQLETDIENDSDVDAVRLALTQNLLCYCSLQATNFKAAIHYGRLSVATFRDARSDFGAAHLPLHIGQAEFLVGHIENARATLQQHFEYCNEELGATADLTLMTQALLTETIIEQGTLTTDSAFLGEAFTRLGMRDSWFDPLASLLVSQIRLAQINNNSAEAEAALSRAEDVAHRRQYRRLADLVAHLRIEVLLKAGQFQEAEQLFALAAARKSDSSTYDPVNLRGSPLEALQARLLLAKGEFDKSLVYLDKAIERHGATENVPRYIRLILQKLQTLVVMGDTANAVSELDRLALTYRIDQYRLPIVEEGPLLARFVTEHFASLDPHSLIQRRLAPTVELITELYPNTETATTTAFAPLTDSESAVITLLARGMTNKEIARDLAVTDNTIKYHLGNIFRKLGVNTRTAAITRARETKILNR